MNQYYRVNPIENQVTNTDNTTKKFNTTTFTYTGDMGSSYNLNQLKKVTTEGNKVVTYKYNGDGLMTERTENGVTSRYYYDGTQIVAEAVVSGATATLKTRYYCGTKGQLVAREDAPGQKAYYLHNGHGDVTELRDDKGALLTKYTYDVWGNPIVTQETVSNPFRYSGEYYDSTTKLQYLRARWYDPSQGRFINEDTNPGNLLNPQSQRMCTPTLLTIH